MSKIEAFLAFTHQVVVLRLIQTVVSRLVCGDTELRIVGPLDVLCEVVALPRAWLLLRGYIDVAALEVARVICNQRNRIHYVL